jgi:hypothetical protein
MWNPFLALSFKGIRPTIAVSVWPTSKLISTLTFTQIRWTSLPRHLFTLSTTYFVKNCFCSSILPGHSKRQWLGINMRRRKWSLSQIFCKTLAASWTHNGSIESKLTVAFRNFFAKQSVRYRVRDILFWSFVLALKCMLCQKVGWYNANLQCLHVDDARILSSWDK